MEKVKAVLRPLIKWDEAYRAALATQGIDSQGKFPTMDWRIRSLMAEHSQVKLVEFHLSLKHLMQFVGVHLIRHPYLLPFIHSQRIDRDQKGEIERITEKFLEVLDEDIKNDPDFNPRWVLPQGTQNDHDLYLNAQTFVNISRKRLCSCASKETRQVWQLVKETMKEVDPAVYHCMVRQCVYRGVCTEMHPACEYWKTEAFQKELHEYRMGIKCYRDFYQTNKK